MLTNLQRGNVRAHTPTVSPVERNVFHLAAQGEWLLLEQKITSGQCRVNDRDEQGCTMLHWAASYGQTATVELLLDKAADPTITNIHGQTALVPACVNGHHNIALILLQHGVDVCQTDSSMNTALIYAVYYGHGQCIKVLLDHGADLTAVNVDSKTAVEIALAKKDASIQDVLERYMLSILES